MIKTEQILLKSGNVLRNVHQGLDKRVLFVCTAGILRSATAARIYAQKYNTRCAGSSVQYALIPVTEELLLWADEVVFVNLSNYFEVVSNGLDVDMCRKFRVLSIEDEYDYMDPELIQQFETQYERL